MRSAHPFAFLFAAPIALLLSSAVHGQVVQQASPRQIDSTVTASTLAFAKALSASDTTALSRMLETGAVLVLPDGNRITGSDDIAKSLLGARFERAHYRVLLEPGDAQFCGTGGIATGTYLISRMDPFGDQSVEGGAMAMSWVIRDGTGHMDRVALAPNGEAQDARRRLSAPCASLNAKTLRGRRVALSLMPFSIGGWSGADKLANDLAGGGWTRQPAIALFTKTYQPDLIDLAHDGRNDPTTYGIVTASVRLTNRTYFSVSGQPVVSEFRLLTYNESQSSRLTQDMKLRETSAAVEVDLGLLRLSAGPAVVTSNVWERFENIVAHDPSLSSTGPARISVESKSYSPSAVAGVASAQLLYPLSSRSFAGLIGRIRAGSSLSVPGVPTHENWSFNTSGYYGGILLGIAW